MDSARKVQKAFIKKKTKRDALLCPLNRRKLLNTRDWLPHLAEEKNTDRVLDSLQYALTEYERFTRNEGISPRLYDATHAVFSYFCHAIVPAKEASDASGRIATALLRYGKLMKALSHYRRDDGAEDIVMINGVLLALCEDKETSSQAIIYALHGAGLTAQAAGFCLDISAVNRLLLALCEQGDATDHGLGNALYGVGFLAQLSELPLDAGAVKRLLVALYERGDANAQEIAIAIYGAGSAAYSGGFVDAMNKKIIMELVSQALSDGLWIDIERQQLLQGMYYLGASDLVQELTQDLLHTQRPEPTRYQQRLCNRLKMSGKLHRESKVELECLFGAWHLDLRIALPNGRQIIIEVDGQHHYINAKLRAKDALRDKWLREQGHVVLRFKNEAIDTDIRSVVNRIVSACKESMQMPAIDVSARRIAAPVTGVASCSAVALLCPHDYAGLLKYDNWLDGLRGQNIDLVLNSLQHALRRYEGFTRNGDLSHELYEASQSVFNQFVRACVHIEENTLNVSLYIASAFHQYGKLMKALSLYRRQDIPGDEVAISALLVTLSQRRDTTAQAIANALHGAGLLAQFCSMRLRPRAVNALLVALGAREDATSQQIAIALCGASSVTQTSELPLDPRTLNHLLLALSERGDVTSLSIANVLLRAGLASQSAGLRVEANAVNRLLLTLSWQSDSATSQQIANAVYGACLAAHSGGYVDDPLSKETIKRLYSQIVLDESFSASDSLRLSQDMCSLGASDIVSCDRKEMPATSSAANAHRVTRPAAGVLSSASTFFLTASAGAGSSTASVFSVTSTDAAHSAASDDPTGSVRMGSSPKS